MRIGNVLSLFDGMSCGQIALQKAGIDCDNYLASEVDKFAIQVCRDNWRGRDSLGRVSQFYTWQMICKISDKLNRGATNHEQ